jgi:hypothetical protein
MGYETRQRVKKRNRKMLSWYHNRSRNLLCPITHDKLKQPIFKYITNKRYVHGYNLEYLIDWILTNKKPIDPVTREEYNSIELKRMDKLAKKYNLNKPSVYDYVKRNELSELIHELRNSNEVFIETYSEFIREISALCISNPQRCYQILLEQCEQNQREVCPPSYQRLITSLKDIVSDLIEEDVDEISSDLFFFSGDSNLISI